MLKPAVHKQFTFTGHKDCIYGLGQGLLPGTFYTGGAEGWIVEWGSRKNSDGRLLVQVGKPVYSFLLLSETRELLCGASGGNLHRVNLEERKETRNITAHTGGIFAIETLPGSNNILTAGGDGKINVWDRQTLTLVKELHHSQKSARAISLHPAGHEMAVGYSDNAIRLLDARNFSLLYEMQGHTNSVFSLAYSPDGKYLLSGGRDAVLRVWDVQKGYTLQQTINAHWFHINHIQYHPTGRILATASMDKTIKLWDAATFELLKVLDFEKLGGHTSSVNKILWIDDKHLISCGDDKVAIVWEITGL